jgi:hypothetical protein
LQTAHEFVQAQATLLQKCKADPVFFVEWALGHYTWSRQREILTSIARNDKTAVRACHGSSKTYTAAEAAVWFLNCFDHSKVITTAPTFTQIKNLLWAEISEIYRTSRIQLEGECLTTLIKTDRADHYAIGFSTDQPARAEGWHAPEILFIFDEAKGIPQWLWDSVRGLLTGGHCRWLAISTTDGVQVGENFYRIFEDKKSDWNRIHISAYDSPFVTGERFKYTDIPDLSRPDRFRRKEVDPADLKIQIANQKYIDSCEREWGRESVLFLTKALGEIADQGADTIVKLSQIEKMFANHDNPEFNDEGQVECGVDVARGGDDDTVFYLRKGLKIVKSRTIPSKELPPEARLVYVANELEGFLNNDKTALVKIDDTGLGGGVTDIMQAREYNVMPVNFQSTSNFPDKYPNLISEMWFEATRGIEAVSCEPNERLKSELVNRKYGIDKKGRRVVEAKKDYKGRGFRSPDDADAFLLCLYNPYGAAGGGEIIWL